MRWPSGVCVIATLSVAALTACAGQSGGEKGRASDPQCFMEILHEGMSISSAGIGATLKYWCEVPPIRHRISVRIQLRDANGRWVTMDERGDRTVPPTTPKTLTVTAPCLPGLWRARGTAVGATRGTDGRVKEFEPAQKDSPERLVSANDCERK
jgi:hypothetical protein